LKEVINHQKVFISYSWTTSEHERWVLELGERLTQDGVVVILDKWDLKEGQDKFAFMEKMVTDTSLNKVLVVCENGYKEKADSRKGGAGTETQIIIPEVYNKVDQNKFIPLIREVADDDFETYMPTYMKGRIAINFSNPSSFEDEYEKLLRLIYDKPLYRKPELGKAPSYLFEEKKTHFKTSKIVKEMRNSLFKHPERMQFHISDFMEKFKNSLEEFSLENSEHKEDVDQSIMDKIRDMKDLRDDYISFLSLIKKGKVDFDIDLIKRLFEELYLYTSFRGGSGSYREYQFDHYKFFITELFLYTIVVLTENEAYEDIYYLTHSRYHFEKFQTEVEFSWLRFYVSSLDEYRNRRLKSNKLSLTAQTLVDRATYNNKDYRKILLDCDLLLFYISMIAENDRTKMWFPMTYVYREYNQKIDLLKRMTSKRHFEKVKGVFEVYSKEEMVKAIKEFKYDGKGYNSSFDRIPNLEFHIPSNKVAINL
jgi:hypothetical protein